MTDLNRSNTSAWNASSRFWWRSLPTACALRPSTFLVQYSSVNGDLGAAKPSTKRCLQPHREPQKVEGGRSSRHEKTQKTRDEGMTDLNRSNTSAWNASSRSLWRSLPTTCALLPSTFLVQYSSVHSRSSLTPCQKDNLSRTCRTENRQGKGKFLLLRVLCGLRGS